MKEIDLLPKWYKSDRRRQINVRRQYIALGGIFVVMLVWNFVAAHSISKAASKIAEEAAKASAAKDASEELDKIKSKMAALQEKAKSIEKIDSKIDVASVLAEISFLVGEKIVLKEVKFSAEKFAGKKAEKPSSRFAVKVVEGASGAKVASPLGDVRFKVVISGVAADASDVAALICRLEESPYFCQVYPSFSRNRKIATGPQAAGEDYQISEFEINCYLANYREQ